MVGSEQGKKPDFPIFTSMICGTPLECVYVKLALGKKQLQTFFGILAAA